MLTVFGTLCNWTLKWNDSLRYEIRHISECVKRVDTDKSAVMNRVRSFKCTKPNVGRVGAPYWHAIYRLIDAVNKRRRQTGSVFEMQEEIFTASVQRKLSQLRQSAGLASCSGGRRGKGGTCCVPNFLQSAKHWKTWRRSDVESFYCTEIWICGGKKIDSSRLWHFQLGINSHI